MAISAKHTKFVSSPYVNALPAEDFIKVALKKQEMYDEGRKQIKQHLDNYGKLRNTIINDNARNYFDQELNKLVKNIQENAGLDFSNMNNVESVINLGKPFENDEYIKNALDNGLEYQRMQKELASVPKDKRNADNDFVYMYEMQQYIQKGGLDTKVTKGKTYQQYVDVKKKLSDIEEKVKGEMETFYRQGKDAPRGYIEKVEIERKTREAVEARMMANLTGEELAQVQIHAQAQMYKLGNDVVYQTWVGHNKEEMLMADQTAKKAMREIAELQAIKKPTAQQMSDLQNAQNILNKSQQIISAAKANANMNPDDFDMEEYLPFFTKRFLSGIVESQAKEVVKSELKEDKIAIMDRGHQQTLAEISARGKEDRRNAEYELELEYTTQSGASTNLLKGVSNVIKKPTGGTRSAQIQDIITQISTNTKIKESTKNRMIEQLTTLKQTYEYAEANKGQGLVATFNRNLGSKYTTSVEDFLTSDPLQLIESGAINTIEVRSRTGASSKSEKSPQEIKAESKAKLEGQLEVKAKLQKDNPELFQMLYGEKGGDKPLDIETLKQLGEALNNQ